MINLSLLKRIALRLLFREKSQTKIEIPCFPRTKSFALELILHFVNRTRSLRSDNNLFNLSRRKPCVHEQLLGGLKHFSVECRFIHKRDALKGVLKLADWSSARTFNRFYNKPINYIPVGTLILS